LNLISFFPHKNRDKDLFKALKNIFGFRPGNIFLYKLAFTYCSSSEDKPDDKKIFENNERLEYLGDAILGAVVADFLFRKFPCKSEGFLTEMRSKIVSRTSLNKLSQKMGIEKLIQTQADHNFLKNSVSGDTFEALIGALYIDKGYRFTKKIIINRIIKCHIDVEELVKKEFNFKSRLLEWTHKEHKTLEFKLRSETTNSANKIYSVDVLIDSMIAGSGEDFSIKKAEQNAAEEALSKLH
jgi:ribonuclease III